MLIEDGLCPLLEGPEQDEGLDPETKAENPSAHFSEHSVCKGPWCHSCVSRDV